MPNYLSSKFRFEQFPGCVYYYYCYYPRTLSYLNMANLGGLLTNNEQFLLYVVVDDLLLLFYGTTEVVIVVLGVVCRILKENSLFDRGCN
jgi:hypothetical protein